MIFILFYFSKYFILFSVTVGIQYYITFGCTAQLLDIYITYEVVSSINLALTWHHTQFYNITMFPVLYLTSRGCFVTTSLYLKIFLLIDLRERERKGGERARETLNCYCTYLYIHWVILLCAQTGDWTHNLGISEWCSNQLSYLARVVLRLWAPTEGQQTSEYMLQLIARLWGQDWSVGGPEPVWLLPLWREARKKEGEWPSMADRCIRISKGTSHPGSNAEVRGVSSPETWGTQRGAREHLHLWLPDVRCSRTGSLDSSHCMTLSVPKETLKTVSRRTANAVCGEWTGERQENQRDELGGWSHDLEVRWVRQLTLQ